MLGDYRAREAAGAFVRNPALAGFGCIRCGTKLPIGDHFEGCPKCFARGEPASVAPLFSRQPRKLSDPDKRGMQRYAEWMPYLSWVTLGEGGTSCVNFASLADEVGAAAVFIKNEGQNPSGSHKDRVSSLTVTRAREAGAAKIVAASSGNGGASLALYAAAAGLDCSVVITPALSPIFRRAIEMCGGRIITARESLERWQIVADMAGEGWYPATNYLNPPVGSNPFGVAGLSSIAFEILEDVGATEVDAVLVPTSRGDLIWGLFAGFNQLRAIGSIKRIPRLFAIEPFPRISQVLAGGNATDLYPGTTALVSIGGSTVTYQATKALDRSGGRAVVVDDGSVMRDQRRLARHGCYAELSSAATLTGLELLLADGTISANERVVLIATSNGYKDLPEEDGG